MSRLSGELKRFAELIGIENTLLIAREFGGAYLYIPKLDGLAREIRDASIRCDFDSGRTVRELARRHNLTERHIYTILGVQPEEDKSFSLPFEL
jgi:Mor family transcriptional regulator